MDRVGFEPTTSAQTTIVHLKSGSIAVVNSKMASNLSNRILINNNVKGWDNYKDYLYASLRSNTARLALKYGKRYCHVLEQMDIKDLLVLPPAKQRHIMKALANLAKYNGAYEQWNKLRRQHQLK
jgi:hypothetical protein